MEEHFVTFPLNTASVCSSVVHDTPGASNRLSGISQTTQRQPTVCVCARVCVHYLRYEERNRTASASSLYSHPHTWVHVCLLCLYVCGNVCVKCVWYLVEYRRVRQDFIQAERLLVAYSVQRGCLCGCVRERVKSDFLFNVSQLCKILILK